MYLSRTLLLLFVLLWAPAIYLGINTHFALVDDYTDWRRILIFSSRENFFNFLSENFLPQSTGARFAPAFVFFSGLTWKLTTTSYSLHHAVRILCQLVGVFGFAKGIEKLFLKLEIGLFPSKIAFWSVLFLASFFPNAPEARLGTQECLVATFLGLVFWKLLPLLCTKDEQSGEKQISWKMLLFLGVFNGLLSQSKELAIGLASVNIAAILFVCRRSNLLVKVLLLFPVAFSFFKVFSAATGGVERAPEFGFTNLQTKWADLSLFSGFSDYKMIVIFPGLAALFFLIKNKSLEKLKSFKLPILLFLIHWFATAGILLQLGKIYLRYAFPLLFVNIGIVVIVWAILFTLLPVKPVYKKIYGFSLTLSFVWVVLANYSNFIYQFSSQHDVRQMEYKVLNQTASLIETGAKVAVYGDFEEADKIHKYFKAFQPHFYNRRFPIAQCLKLEDCSQDADYIVAREESLPNYKESQVILRAPEHLIYKIAKQISRIFNKNQIPLEWTDSAGAHHWYTRWYVLKKL